MPLSYFHCIACGLLFIVCEANGQVPFVAETDAVASGSAGDVAIVTSDDAETTPPLIVASDDRHNGLWVFLLDGKHVQTLSLGFIRGVDVRYDVTLPRAFSKLVAAAAPVTNSIALTTQHGAGLMNVVTEPIRAYAPTALALYRHDDGTLEVIAADQTGNLQQTRLNAHHSDAVRGIQQGTITVSGAPSSLVVDDRSGTLYAAIPNHGIDAVDLANATSSTLIALDEGQFGGPVGGITLYPLPDGKNLLLTTVPTLNEVTVHELHRAKYLTRFSVGSGVNKVRRPQHIDVVTRKLPGFDAGLLVIHDGVENNYKLVSLEKLAQSTQIPLPSKNSTMANMQADAGPSKAMTDNSGGGTPTDSQYINCGCGAVQTAFGGTWLYLWFLVTKRRLRASHA